MTKKQIYVGTKAIFSVKILSYPMQGDNLEGCLHPSKYPRTFSLHECVGYVTCILSRVLNDNILTHEKSPMGLTPLSNKQYRFENFSLCFLNLITI
jgi:hypothetical protein